MDVRGRFKYVLALVLVIIIASAVVFAFNDNYIGDDQNLYAVITVNRGQPIGDVLPVAPEIIGYRFSHWSLSPDGVPFDFEQYIYEEATFYAIWLTFNEYTYSTGIDYNEYSYLAEAPYHDYDTITVRFMWNRGGMLANDDNFPGNFYESGVYYDALDEDYTSYINYITDDYNDYDYSYDDYFASYENYASEEDNESDISEEPFNPIGIYYALDISVNIDVDDRGNVSLYPNLAHGIILDDGVIYVRIPLMLELGNIDINLPYGWTYELNHEGRGAARANLDSEYDELHEHGAIGDAPFELGQRTYTVITFYHTWNQDSGYIGIMPFSTVVLSGITFTVETVATSFTPQDWNDALLPNTAGNNRLVIVPANATIPGQVALSGNRHIIIVSEGTNLQGSIDDHIFSGTPSTITHDGGAVRFFTVANTTTLTLSHITLDGNIHPPTTTNRGGILVNAGGNLHMLDGSRIQHSRAANGGGVALSGATGAFTMSGNASLVNNSAGTAGGGLHISGGARQSFISGNSSISYNNAPNGGGVAITSASANNLPHLTMSGDATISGNTATTSGGGVNILTTSGGRFHMESGSITGNFANGTAATQGGGGVAIAIGTAAVNSVFTMSGGNISGNTAQNGGGVLLAAAGARFIMDGGTIGGTAPGSVNTAHVNGGGVVLAANSARFYMETGANIVGNIANGTGAAQGGGGVAITHGTAAATTHFTLEGGNISGNTAQNGGGVMLAAAGARFNMENGTIGGTAPGTGNIANIRGGGVAIVTNSGRFYMDDGSISGNHANGVLAANGGGGVFVEGAASAFTMTNGSITHNNAVMNGGGVFASVFSHFLFLPNNAYPQLNIASLAIFNNNTAQNGSSNPPINALTATQILTTQASSTFNHPLNNLDINFYSTEGDWLLLNSVITNGVDVTNIVIHPEGTPGVSTGLAGTTFNFVISPGNGSTITTAPIPAAPAADPHRINVTNNTIIIEARPGSNIVLNMTALTAPNASVNIGRHFLVGANGNLTLGGGASSGNLILNGNIGLAATGTRGGININATTGVLTLAEGASIINSRAASGAVQLGSNSSRFYMTGGSIVGNTATTSGGGVAITTATAAANSVFTMTGGNISGNNAPSGGGVALAAIGARFILDGGTIGGTLPGEANTATTNGGGVGFTTGNGARMYMESGSIVGNFANGTGATQGGGGVAIASGAATAPSYFTMRGGNISGNTANRGGGVILTTAGARLIMEDGTIGGMALGAGNTANINGGGVAIVSNSATFVMEDGDISGNFANGTLVGNGGGGVYITGAANLLSHFTFENGTIRNNHAVMNGGGIFAAAFTVARYLPQNSFPQLTVDATAAFTGNTSGLGGFDPPANAVVATNINITNPAQVSGPFDHPINNLDINFGPIVLTDWNLLSSVINSGMVDTIIIHPTDATGVTHGWDGNIYNLVISDPGGGSMITTTNISGTTNHVINVSGSVTVQAAYGAEIIIRMPLPNAPNTPNEELFITTLAALSRHFHIMNGAVFAIGGGPGSGTLTIDGNASFNTSARGGITVAAGGSLLLQQGGVLFNNRAAIGGAVNVTGTAALPGMFNMTGGSILNNFASTTTVASGGAGVALVATNTHFTLSGGTISGNVATTSGGGVALTANGAVFTMTGGYISGNNANTANAAGGGGGVFIAAGAASHFTFENGTIQNNHANSHGGGIFTTAFSYMNPLPANSYPQLTIEPNAVFANNTSNNGGFNPPSNALAATAINIINPAHVSGGFSHPLNNLDINFINIEADWFRLNSIINGLFDVNTIIIHPKGAPGINHGQVGSTFNFVISDPYDDFTISTIHLQGGTSDHNIIINRPITIQAATGANITIRMPLPGAPNTPDEAPWLTTSAALSRHFIINAGGELTLGGGTGTITLDGNANLNTSNRGGVTVNANGGLVMNTGGIISNNRLATGGGVSLAGNPAVLNMSGGSISNNFATNGAGVAITANGGQITMTSGDISSNTALALGGGVHLAAGALSFFHFHGGVIQNNHAAADGGGIFTLTHTYQNSLPTVGAPHFPQLSVQAPAQFINNIAGNGGFTPPGNAVMYTNIDPVPSSDGFGHPLNNLDINFLPNDWIRLNTIISTMTAITQIIIYPAGTPGITPGPDGSVYHFVITDPGNGSTITTVPVLNAPAADSHRINVLRQVSIEAASGANITLAMTANATQTGALNIGRHFYAGLNSNFTLGGGSASGNLILNAFAANHTGTRGGVVINNANGQFTLNAGGIISHGRAVSGGGVELQVNGAQFTMNSGMINNNFSTGTTIASQGGGGISVTGADSRVTIYSGAILNNNAVSNGGGIFASVFTYSNPLPAVGVPHYPQLRIYSPTIFNGNASALGIAPPPSNAAGYTNIENTASSSGLSHALNNYDINFFVLGADWARLHRLITEETMPYIIIHEANSGVTPGLELPGGNIYNFVITDPCPYGEGRTITTVHLQGGTSAVNINITNRTVNIAAADGANIIIRMPVPSALNTPATAPWITTQNALARHFTIGSGGNLTLGGIGTGTLTLDGNASLIPGTAAGTPLRGGIQINASGHLELQAGGIITNNRAGIGGGVGIANFGEFTMTGGTISNNSAVAITTGWQGGGGGVGFTSTQHDALFTMYGGNIINNNAGHGGGMWAMGGTFIMHNGMIAGNTAGYGTGSHFVSNGNNRHGAGGGVMVCCSGDFIMHNGVVEGNTARVGGGVFMSHRGNSNDPAWPPATLIMSGGCIINNHATVSHLNPSDIDVPGGPGATLLAPGIGLRFDEDGGGVFITESGEFVLQNPDPSIVNPPPINISGNTADNHGGGVYWEVGLWETDQRTQPVIISGNTALKDGGGIFTAYGTLEMFGYWEITDNSANRGGGIFLSGDASPCDCCDPAVSWHVDYGPAYLIMHDGLISNNWSYTSGGGVYIYRYAAFYMLDGAIDNNHSAIFGGGVYVLNPVEVEDDEEYIAPFTPRFHVMGGSVTRNTAIYGGGVYLMYRAHLFADNVTFAGNIAERMGGAIFTELVDYGYNLSGEDVSHDILFPRPPVNETFVAFSNIVTTETVRFRGEIYVFDPELDDYVLMNRGNSAIAPFHAPYNARDMLTYDQPDGQGGFVPGNIRWHQWDLANQWHEYLSIHIHPFNNYDINYVRPVYFYKTDMGVYDFPATINNLEGAVFNLYMWAFCDDKGDNDWIFYTQATSEANGRVALFVFHEGDFKLREVFPPPGPGMSILPPGHWYLSLSMEDFEVVPNLGIFDQLLYIVDPPPQTCPLNFDFPFVLLDRETGGTIDCEGTQEARMRWHVGNAPIRASMYLHKTGQDIFDRNPTIVEDIEDILRAGAVFALYRYTGDGTPDDAMMPASGWVRTPLRTSSNDPDDPMYFGLLFRMDQNTSYYQLVEEVAPFGYAAPFGQWRITLEVLDLIVGTYTISVETVGDAPTLTPLDGEDGYVFALGNRTDFELPLTGGFGSRHGGALTAVGIALIIGGGTYLFVAKKKARRVSL